MYGIAIMIIMCNYAIIRVFYTMKYVDVMDSNS